MPIPPHFAPTLVLDDVNRGSRHYIYRKKKCGCLRLSRELEVLRRERSCPWTSCQSIGLCMLLWTGGDISLRLIREMLLSIRTPRSEILVLGWGLSYRPGSSECGGRLAGALASSVVRVNIT